MAGIQDLLGGIGGKLKGLLSNPTVQGLAGAAAFGANPLVGLLAAPGIKSSRDRRELANKEARRKFDAIERVPDLLGQRVGSGESVTFPGMNLLGLDGEAQELPGRREQITQPYVNTPEGLAEYKGLLAAINPDTFVQGEVTNQPSGQDESALIRDIRAIGLDPLVGEGNKMARASIERRGVGSIDERMNNLELMAMEDKLADSRDDKEREKLTQRIAQSTAKSAAYRSLGQLEELSTLNDVVANSKWIGNPLVMQLFGEKGVQAAAAFAATLGADVQQVTRELNALERFNTVGGQLAVLRLSGDAAEFADSDNKFNTFKQTKPNSNIGGPTNAFTIADTIDEMLEFFDSNEWEVDNREKWEELARSQRAKYAGSFGEGGSGNSVSPLGPEWEEER